MGSDTVTFLFTDIEGSTRLLQLLGDRYAALLFDQRRLLRVAFDRWGGHELGTEGDSFFVAFSRAPDAVAAAVDAQHALAAHPWPENAPVRVRMGLHTGEPTLTPEGYIGLDVHRAARINACGHGGQILLSQRTRDLVAEASPAGVSLKDMGAHRLKDLLQPEHLFQVVIEGLPADFPPLKSLEAHAHNLPLQLSSFVGREREIGEVKALLGKARLLTLTGTGGTGKTRLALQVGAELVEEYADGVWQVELAALTEPSLVPQAVASAFHLREEPGRTLTDTLVDYLRPKQVLLVLDNCEHLVDACARLSATLLQRCPRLTLLATSRESLSVPGEVTWRVPSLPVPDPERLPLRSAERLAALSRYEGVGLFLERAFQHQPRFAVTEGNAKALAEVCFRLDGIPLAIELAAARVKAMPVEKIAERLDDRFRLLTGGSRTVLPRQQTLQALVDWSYDLLSASERVLLRRLSVFAGGWTLEAAEKVCSGAGTSGSGGEPPERGATAGGSLSEEPEIEEWEVLDLLTSLVEKSLVQYEEAEGESRYRLLETIRQYGIERLRQSGEEEFWRGRHRDWSLALAEQASLELQGPEQAKWHGRLEEERENLRAAHSWTLARGEADAALRFGAALWRFWDTRGYWAEGRARLTEALALSTGERSLPRIRVLIAVSTLADQQCDYDAAWATSEECLALCREMENPRGIASSLLVMANVAWSRGELPKARSLLEEVLAIERTQEAPRGIAAALNNLAGVVYEQGDLDTARSLYEEALAVRRPLGDRRGIATSLTNLGIVTHVQDDIPAAHALYEEALAIFRELGDRQNTATVLQNLGSVRNTQGDAEGARRLYEESLTIRRELDERRGIASSQSKLGTLARRQGEYEHSYQCHAESLILHQAIGNRLGMTEDLNDLGLLGAEAGEREWAARLLGAADAQREALGAPLFPVDQADTERATAELRVALGEEAFVAAWTVGRAMTLEAAVALALGEGDARYHAKTPE